ncbi:MAG: HEAT repeat domain-containing protein [Thermodesulfobacteriota bacterium]
MPEELSIGKKSIDLSGEEIPLKEGIEADEEFLLARDLASHLIKTIKAFRFYPLDNPAIKGFKEQLFKRLQFFLNKYSIFKLQVGEYELSFKGKILYENRDPKSSIAFLFYKDGIRELRFMKDIEEWEIEGFMEVIRGRENLNELEDDIVTLLWERDFPHLSYMATDEFLEETPILIPENIHQFRSKLVFKPLAYNVQVDLEEEGEQDIDSLLSQMDRVAPIEDRNVYFLTPEELDRLKAEVESETDPSFVFHVVDTLFEIIAWEKEPEPYQEAINILGKVLDAFITLSEFKKASELLGRLNIILKTYELKDWQRESIYKLIQNAGDEIRIERIGRILDREEGVQLEEVKGYLAFLQQNSITPLIKILGELKNSKTRRVICDVLSEIGKNSIELFLPFLEDKRWFLVRNIIYILGRIGKEKAIPYVQKVLNHEEVRVRREAVQALGLIGGSKAISLLIKALNDKDARIRAMAATNLGRIGKTIGLAALLEAVQSKDFQKREASEIKAFFDGIGMIGSNDAIPVLQQLLERKSLFGLGRMDEIRILAANTLAMIGTPEAKALLEKGKSSKEESVRKACIQALKLKSPKE